MTKSLLLKGLGGVAAVGGVVGGGFVLHNRGLLGGGNKPGEALNVKTASISHKQLIDKAGLDCGLTGKELKESEEKECSVKSEGTITVKVDSQTEEGVTFTTSDSAKLKVRRSKGGESYNRELKFVVDSGDITLSKKTAGSSPSTITKLEQFETYEIKEEEGKYYLSRKTKADVGIKNALGLGSFSLPTAGKEADRSFNDAAQIKEIKFEGHSEGITVTAGSSITLKVSKTVDTTTFPFGYRFNFTFPADITVNGKQLKGKIPYEFKIKKGTGNSLTLEQAWTDDNTFTKKAGLSCGTNNECSVSSTESQKLNVKLGHQKKEGITTVSTGKIKVEKDQQGYNQGLKFSIDGGNASLTGGTGDEITTLEELETYEIAEYEGKYYLTKKTSPDELIKSSLSLPDGCKLPTTDASVSCNLDETNFKKINFDGKESEKPTGTATLTISKANATDFPFGYKFTFKTETADAEIKTNTKIKAKIPTDFKIKKGSGTGASVTLSLEKAWDDSTYSLAKKVGLTCTNSSGTVTCSKESSSQEKLNVKKGTDKKEGITGINGAGGSTQGKIKVEKDKEGYNQGLKFTITTADVTLSGGSSAGGADFSSLEELETYEITEDKGKYYLTRKTSKEDVLKTSLSIPEKCFTSQCTLTTDEFKGIKFDGKDGNGPTGTATLTITKADSKDFPLGYRFTFNTTAEATIKSDIKIKKNIPTDFKIKKGSESGDTPSLTLEKAWSEFSFAEKVGLSCTSGSDCCSKNSGSEQLNIKKGNEKKDGITSFAGTNSGSGKIKVEKDKEGYNQGLKFTISEGSITLTGGSAPAGGTGTFTTLDEYETYEITEEGGKYYLTRKEEASKTIETQLSLPSTCKLSSGSCTLTTEDIKKINFEGKDTNGATMANGTATLKITNASSNSDFPLGYKFSLQSQQDITIKNGNVVKKNTPYDFKIKKPSGSGSLSLEKAWSDTKFAEKVGLSCTNGTGETCCTKTGSNQLNIKKGDDTKTNITSFSGSGSSGGKIKVEKDQEGYNQGLKFTISGGDVKLTGGSGASSSSKEDLSTLEEYETYEIKEEGSKYYLTRRDESIVYIKKQLGIDSFCSDDSWTRSGSSSHGYNITFMCDGIKDGNLKKIKFNNSGESFSWPTGNIDLMLEIKGQRTNNTDKYDELKVTISNNGSGRGGSSSICIPDGNGGKVDVKSGSGAEYKIKKSDSSWCLEKKSGGSGSSGSCK